MSQTSLQTARRAGEEERFVVVVGNETKGKVRVADEFPSETVTFFVRMALGGPAIGIAFGFAALACLKLSSYQFVDSEKTIQLLITLTTAYLSYYVADAVAHSSGVLSCVFAARGDRRPVSLSLDVRRLGRRLLHRIVKTVSRLRVVCVCVLCFL